ncbi:cytidine deaminase [Alkalitalea saponilacus]|uniref:Cytidine deaminase n=1 Tax=Alkalitalea saponilacus TaxID=889453 RepID=A0A1T5HH78_9BACT|nr:cytidine deaminase [Alkalitalea saponilacus]ASB48140.1 cytidine deaminase [Alkalitalea saponilacus]SKC20058.1 cytidine deaminase [Alkalitalea saponilacus]
MQSHKMTISYTEYQSVDQLSPGDRELAEKAIISATSAYAPYSGFNVGTAIKLKNGEIICGNNQENAAYPSGLCAERVALFYAGANFPDVPVSSMAVVALKNGEITNQVISPCGSCRQVIVETSHRYKQNFPIILIGKHNIVKIDDATGLLPLIFGPDNF